MSTSSHPSSGVPQLTNPREFMSAITELRALVPAESVSRMYDLLTAIVDYTDRQARQQAIEVARGERLTDNTGTTEDGAYNQAIDDVIRALADGGAR